MNILWIRHLKKNVCSYPYFRLQIYNYLPKMYKHDGLNMEKV